MAWQDELAALDDALAQGRVTPDQHRSERDRILASVSSMPPLLGAPDAPGTDASKWQVANPMAAGQTPPPGDSDRTQVVPGGGDPNKTAYVQMPRGGFPPSPPNQLHQPGQPHQHGQPNRQNQPPHPQQPNQQFAPSQAAPPWASQDAGGQNWGYAKQGPEVFDDAESGGGKKWLLVGLVVVLLLSGGAVWYFGFRGDGSEQGGGTTSTTAGTPQVEAVTLDRLPNPPGKVNEATTGEFTLDEAKTKKMLNAVEHKAIVTAGTEKFSHKSSTDSGVGYAVSAYPTKDEDAATGLGDALVGQHTSIGMTAMKLPGLPENVSVMKVHLVKSDQHLIRAVYVTGDTTIRVGVLAPGKLSEAKVTEALDKFLKQVMEAVPAK